MPGNGRFASADTIVPDPANPQSFNRYSYVRNNPINRADPSGHTDLDCGHGEYGFKGNTWIGEWLGWDVAWDAYNPEGVDLPFVTEINEPKPEFPIIAPWDQELGSDISTVTDHFGVRLSDLKTAISAIGIASNLGVPIFADVATDELEDLFDLPSLIADVAGEIFNGNTRTAFESNGMFPNLEVTVILSQDTSQTAALMLLDKLLPGSEVDFAINAYETYYTTKKLRGEMPNRWETRIGTVDPYIEVRRYGP